MGGERQPENVCLLNDYHQPRECPPEIMLANAPVNPKTTIDPKLILFTSFVFVELIIQQREKDRYVRKMFLIVEICSVQDYT